MKKRVIVIVAVLLIVIGGGWYLNLPQRFGWEEAEQTGLTLYGNVDIREVNLGFRVAGRVTELLADEGDEVQPGQVLARLDSSTYEFAVESAKATVASQAAVLDKLTAGPRPAEIDRARASLAARKAELANARLAYKRALDLRPRDLVSQSGLDQAKAAKDMAEAQVAAEQESLRLLEEGTRPEDLAAARANLLYAKAGLAAAETALQDTELKAADNGVILSRVHERGSIVSPGETVFVQSLQEPVWVRAYVSETDLGHIHPGMKVDIISDSAPNHPYEGKVGYISPVAEFTPKSVETPDLRTDLVYRLRIIVKEANNGLRQGMPVTVHLSPTDPDQA